MSDAVFPIPERGRLAQICLPRILVVLHRARFDGTLELSRARSQKSFVFDQGSPIQADSNLASEGLAVQLVSQGLLAEGARDRIASYTTQKRCSESVAVLALKLLEPKALIAALKEQLRRRLLDCFGWPEADYRLLAATAARPEHARAFRSDPVVLCQEGLEIHWGAERMLADLSPHMDAYPQPGRQFSDLLARLRSDAGSHALLASLTGQCSLAQAIACAAGSPRALAVVWLLDASGALIWGAGPLQSAEAAAFDAEIEIQVQAAALAPAAPSTQAATPAPDQPGAGEVGAQLRAEILTRLESLSQLDHYEVLGIPADAKGAQIKKAYFKAAKRYHPDALARLGLGEIREAAATVFASIAEAFETLSDERKRSDYDASLRDHGPRIDGHRVAQAETAYRKGEILVRMGDYRGALEFLQAAVDLWPDECAYQATLGWALYRKSPSDPATARVHLEKAIDLDAGDAVAYFRLSAVLRALGEEAAATRMADVARRINPTVAG